MRGEKEYEKSSSVFINGNLNCYVHGKKDTVRVAYDVNKKTADIAKDNADVSSYKELGKTTFNYYVKMEGIDYE